MVKHLKTIQPGMTAKSRMSYEAVSPNYVKRRTNEKHTDVLSDRFYEPH